MGFHSEYAVYASWKQPEIFLCFIIFDRRGCWWLSRVSRLALCWTSLASALQSSLFSAPASPAQMWVFLQSHHVVFILGETETQKRWRSQRFGLMFTCEWPADSNPCPGCYYWLPWRCNIRLKQVQGLAEQIVLKQPKQPATFQLRFCLWRAWELSGVIKNILICVPNMNEGLLDLERHAGGAINDRIFILGWTITLNTI